MLRIRANCVLFPWVPELRTPTPGSTFPRLRGQYDLAYLNRTVIVAGRKEVWGRVHDAIDGCAAGGLYTGFIDAPPVHNTHSCTLWRFSDTVPVLVSMTLTARTKMITYLARDQMTLRRTEGTCFSQLRRELSHLGSM